MKSMNRKLDRPTTVVFDCDPGEGADIHTCARVALLLRDVLAGLRLKSFPKVSGSKGIQVYVPLNTDATYAATQPFAKAIADLLASEHPKLTVSEMPKALRRNKVFIDWSQNADFKTTVGVYSLRAKADRPFVSMPVEWDELESGEQLYFTPDDARRRLEDIGDLFAPVLSLKQRLPAAPAVRKSAAKKRTSSRTALPRRSKQGSWRLVLPKALPEENDESK